MEKQEERDKRAAAGEQMEEEDEEENLSTSWNVHYKKEYRFHLMQAGGTWLVSNRYGKDIPNVDRDLSRKVEHVLKTLL